MADLGFLVLAMAAAVGVWLTVRTERRRPSSGLVPHVFLCDSCDGSIARHNELCPRITGKEMPPFVDTRRVP